MSSDCSPLKLNHVTCTCLEVKPEVRDVFHFTITSLRWIVIIVSCLTHNTPSYSVQKSVSWFCHSVTTIQIQLWFPCRPPLLRWCNFLTSDFTFSTQDLFLVLKGSVVTEPFLQFCQDHSEFWDLPPMALQALPLPDYKRLTNYNFMKTKVRKALSISLCLSLIYLGVFLINFLIL